MDFPLWSYFTNNIATFLEKLPYHQRLVKQLSMVDIATTPNIVLYGSKGFPHTPLIELAICHIAGVSYPMAKRNPVWNGTIPYVETDYYFEVNLSHPSIPKDIEELIGFLLSIIRNRPILGDRHILILQHIHVLQDTNPQAFRVILERFSKNALFFGTTNYLHRLEAPLLSRMALFRVPLPNEQENVAIVEGLLCRTGGKEKGKGKGKEKIDTSRCKGRNLLRNIFYYEPFVYKKMKGIPPYCSVWLEEIATKKLEREEIRQVAFRLFQSGVELRDIVEDLLATLPEEGKGRFLREACATEHTACQIDTTKRCFAYETILNKYGLYKYDSLH